jgi:hypothetical protein
MIGDSIILISGMIIGVSVCLLVFLYLEWEKKEVEKK